MQDVLGKTPVDDSCRSISGCASNRAAMPFTVELPDDFVTISAAAAPSDFLLVSGNFGWRRHHRRLDAERAARRRASRRGGRRRARGRAHGRTRRRQPHGVALRRRARRGRRPAPTFVDADAAGDGRHRGVVDLCAPRAGRRARADPVAAGRAVGGAAEDARHRRARARTSGSTASALRQLARHGGGTFDDGASGDAWMCLVDGCYLLEVDAAPGRYTQISFSICPRSSDSHGRRRRRRRAARRRWGDAEPPEPCERRRHPRPMTPPHSLTSSA